MSRAGQDNCYQHEPSLFCQNSEESQVSPRAAPAAPGISRFVGFLDVQVVMWTSKVDGWLSELLMNYFVWDEGKCFLANLSWLPILR